MVNLKRQSAANGENDNNSDNDDDDEDYDEDNDDLFQRGNTLNFQKYRCNYVDRALTALSRDAIC